MTEKNARPVYRELYDEVGSVYADPETDIKFDCWAVEDLDDYDPRESFDTNEIQAFIIADEKALIKDDQDRIDSATNNTLLRPAANSFLRFFEHALSKGEPLVASAVRAAIAADCLADISDEKQRIACRTLAGSGANQIAVLFLYDVEYKDKVEFLYADLKHWIAGRVYNVTPRYPDEWNCVCGSDAPDDGCDCLAAAEEVFEAAESDRAKFGIYAWSPLEALIEWGAPANELLGVE